MPLTPEDVSRKKFTAVRLREGYGMGEVDAFLDEVEAELTRLHSENAELRAKLEAALAGQPAPAGGAASPDEVTNGAVVTDGTAAGTGDGTAACPVSRAVYDETPDSMTQPAQPAQPTTEPAQPVTQPTTPVDGAAEGAADGAPATSLDKPRPVETIKVSTTAEASAAATRLLELATRSADELMDDAQTEAERILAAARADAERLEHEARSRAQQLDVETDQRREQLFSSLERDRTALTSEVESLRTFEREYRAELKDYFTKQLDALEHPLAHSERFGTAGDPTGSRVAEPPRTAGS